MQIEIKGVDKAIRDLKERKNGQILHNIIAKLANEGLEIARYGFQNAIYDGDNDVTVSIQWESDTKCRLLAHGAHVLFIEFGSGTHYPEHPKADELGMKHGKYGHGRGYEPKYPKGWVYEGSMGQNPTGYAHHPSRTNKDGSKSAPDTSKVRTLGNPPSMTMYATGRYLHERVEQIVKEATK